MILKVPSIPNSDVRADWAELSCLFNDDDEISQAELMEALQSHGLGRRAGRIIDDIFGEINWRNSIGNKYYPFYTDGNLINRKYSWEYNILYSYQLLLSRNGFFENTRLKKKKKNDQCKMFERIVSVAVKKYIGKSINIGSPRSGRMNRSLKKSLNLFCQLSNESLRDKPEISHYSKDEGVDVIAWSPIDDRAGHVTLLVQCTIESDWHKSAGKIDVATWNNIVNFTCKPYKALAFPFISHAQWKTRSTKGGILLDRLRIVKMYKELQTNYLMNPLRLWVNTQKERLDWFT